jgi:hypothetical protein
MIDTDASNPLNWQVTVSPPSPPPPPGDPGDPGSPGDPGVIGIGITTPPPPSLPGAGDDVYFNSVAVYDFGTGHSRDCDNLTSSAGSFASVHIQTGYTGTVSLGAALSLGTFELASGAISQPTLGTDLTVTSSFNWTGGTLNSDPINAATLNLNGAAATVTPQSTDAIVTGDTFNTLNGASLTINPGTIQFNNGTGITLGENTSMFVNANAPPGQLPNVTITGNGMPWNQTDTQITLNTGATLTVTGPGIWNDSKHAIDNLGGTVEIKDNATVNLTASTDPTVSLFYQYTGTTNLHSGSTLGAGMILALGNLNIIGDSPNGATTPAILNGSMKFSGGGIFFTGNLWTFSVTGDVNWLGGSFNPRVDVSTNGGSDIWLISGKLTIPNNSTAQVVPMTLNWNPNTGILADWRWDPLLFGSVQLPDNGALPTIVTIPGNAPMKFFPTQINGKTHWLLGPQRN